MPIQPFSVHSYSKIDDIDEDITPAGSEMFATSLFSDRKKVLLMVLVVSATTLGFILLYFGSHHVTSNGILIYQTSIGTVGGLHSILSNVSCMSLKGSSANKNSGCGSVLNHRAVLTIQRSKKFQQIIQSRAQNPVL